MFVIVAAVYVMLEAFSAMAVAKRARASAT
jgi:hypothetical protein